MPKKITIQTELEKFEDPWGGKYHSGEDQPFHGVTLKDNQEWGHTREHIEEAIKNKVKSLETGKFGAALATKEEGTLKVFVRFFASVHDMELWESDHDTYKDLVIGNFNFQGADKPKGYTLAVSVVKPLALTQVLGNENKFTFNYNSYHAGDPTNFDADPGLVTLKVNGGVMEEVPIQGGGNRQVSVDAGKFCTEDSNTVEITVSNSHGDSRTWHYLVQAMTLGIELDASYTNQQHIAKTSNWDLPVVVSDLGGNACVKVDDGNPMSAYVGSNSSYTFKIDPNNTLAAGVHTLDIWCENKTNFDISTEHIYTQFIKAGNDVVLALGMNPASEMTLYSTVSIPYFFYHPDKAEGEDVEVTINLYDGSNVPVNHTTQNIVVDGNHSSGIKEAKVQLVDNYYIGQTMRLVISIGNVNLQHTIKVNAAGVTLQEASECKVHYDLSIKSDNDDDVLSEDGIPSYYDGQVTAHLKLSEDFIKDDSDYGFRDGGCIIPANKSLTLTDWQPFKTDFGANGTQTGKTIEMELSVGVCVNQDIPVVSCMDDNCGFNVFPNRVEVMYNGGADRIITYFPDEERVKFSLVINGTTTVYGENDRKNLGFIYMNGVMVRIFDYGNARWKQSSVQNIVFGSTEGRVKLYSFRGYDKALSMKEILDNFVYDIPDETSDLRNKLAIARRNNVLKSDGKTVDLNKIAEALPNTPIITWIAEELPLQKGQAKKCTTEFVNPDWISEKGNARAPFTAGEHDIDVDGTSSASYPFPYKNWAEKYDGMTLHLISGNLDVAKYSITYGINDKEKKFVHKVNYASSEGIFNILAMNMYQQLTLATKNQITDLLSKQQSEQDRVGDDITFRKSLSGFPEIGFWNHTSNGQEVTEFISIYNFINNKKTGSMFGMEDNYKKNQLWEVDENRNFFLAKMTENTVESGQLVRSNGVNDQNNTLYYARYPSDSPVNETDGKTNDLGVCKNVLQVDQANDEIRALREIHNWIYSINPNVAKRYMARYGDYRPFTLADDGFTSITFGAGTANEETFTRDSLQYRCRKFLEEYTNHLHINDCIFYFLFCTWILGKDSMDKNMSLFLDDLEAFYSPIPEVSSNAQVKLRIMLRDTDTVNMFSNTGKLIYKYWHEWNDVFMAYRDTQTGDYIEQTGQITGEKWNGSSYVLDSTIWDEEHGAGDPVFNGRLSGLWDAITMWIPDQIKTVYQTMRSEGLNYNSMLAMYQNFRNYWCEALYNVDGMGYASSGNIDMAYGDKLLLSKFFYKYRERYMDSKYGVTDLHPRVSLRLSDVPVGVWMTHYTPMYASFSFGGATPSVTRSIDVGTKALIPCNNIGSFSDADSYVNDADMVTEIGFYTMDGNTPVFHGLEGVRGFAFTRDFSNFVRLTRFIWNNPQNRQNTAQTTAAGTLDFSGMKMLRELVMKYCAGWQDAPVIGSEIIETIDFTGTPITAITIPETETLTTLHLPGTLTELKLMNLPNLANFSIQGVANLETVEIENTPLVAEAVANAIVALVEGGGTPVISNGKLNLPDISNTNFWRLYNTLGAEVFDPENDLSIEVPQGVYIYLASLDIEAGLSQTLQAVAIGSDYEGASVIYKMYKSNHDEISPVEGIATSDNGTTLDITTGEITTIVNVDDDFYVRAVAVIGGVEVPGAISEEIHVTPTAYDYPTISINGSDEIRTDRSINYGLNISTGYTARLIDTKWEVIDESHSGVIQSIEELSRGCILTVSGVGDTLRRITLKVTARFEYRNIEATKSIDIQLMRFRFVDLGIGTLWANMDLGASLPEGEGRYYQWGDTEGHTRESGYSFDQANYNNKGLNNISANLSEENDAAAVELAEEFGAGPRIPSRSDWQNLIANTDSIYVVINEVYGRKFVSRINGNSIFIPRYGVRNGNNPLYASELFRWSSSRYSDSAAYNYYANANNQESARTLNRFFGVLIRPVKS